MYCDEVKFYGQMMSPIELNYTEPITLASAPIMVPEDYIQQFSVAQSLLEPTSTNFVDFAAGPVGNFFHQPSTSDLMQGGFSPQWSAMEVDEGYDSSRSASPFWQLENGPIDSASNRNQPSAQPLPLIRNDEWRISAGDIAELVHRRLFPEFIDTQLMTSEDERDFERIAVIRINCDDENSRDNSAVYNAIRWRFGKQPLPVKRDSVDRDAFWQAIANVGRQTTTRRFTSRADYLVTAQEMCEHEFPLSGQPETVVTRPYYAPVTNSSPLFVLDCEMCITTRTPAGKPNFELTRISIINEEGDVLLDTLVRPYNAVTDHVTAYSGITPEMLDGVRTRLDDVQRAIARLLPPDAILCGHGLHGDLKALKMAHPYCIDTSLQYNLRGDPRLRSRLRDLCDIFLGCRIQTGALGHCSIEDCVATLDLVKLKLRKGLKFGNVFRGWKAESDEAVFHTATTTNSSVTPAERRLACDRCARQLRVTCPANGQCMCAARRDLASRCAACMADAELADRWAALANRCPSPTPSTSSMDDDGRLSFDQAIPIGEFPLEANLATCLRFVGGANLLLSARRPTDFVPAIIAEMCTLHDASEDDELDASPVVSIGKHDASVVEIDARATAGEECGSGEMRALHAIDDAFKYAIPGTLLVVMLAGSNNGAVYMKLF